MEEIVGIISDYGLKDHYVGTVHAVIKGISPSIQIVDISHQVRAFDILDAALKLKWSYGYFPVGTVFLCLVDPEPEALPIIVSTERYFLVCPNNGVGSLMFEEEPPQALYKITAEHYFIEGRGNFRGRNQLAPIAAELSRLQSARHLGEEMELSQLKRFKLPAPKPLGNDAFECIVLDVDHFGNLITNFVFDGKLPKVAEINGVRIEKSSDNFAGFEKGELFISVNPENHIEIVAYMASAAKLLKAGRGAKVKLYF
ncbi:MAG: SAM-dependent chlorinase/fluorinase [Thermotogae bacterium]|nr:SAM-dependent chlorinase/fluorinase [Thermotogota bacterium]